jgi:hypothetical protein
MPCHFNASWLDKIDPNGYNVRERGRKQSDSEMFCTVCIKKFSIVKGFCAVSQHAESLVEQQRRTLRINWLQHSLNRRFQEKMLMLGSDGPNVNKAVFKPVNNDLLVIRN